MQFSTRHVMSARRAQWGHFSFSRVAATAPKERPAPQPEDAAEPEAKIKVPESMYQRYPLVTD